MYTIDDGYYEWLFDLVCKRRYSSQISYSKLLTRLHELTFRYSIPRDRNRAEDGMDLRYRYAVMSDGYESRDVIIETLDGPCSVLEMMIALAIRCEENIMDDPNLGDRTGQWFWGMIVSLGLGDMIDSNFDIDFVDDTIDRFLNREYQPNGRGGLFTIKECEYDLRGVEIWYQLCWYLDSIT